MAKAPNTYEVKLKQGEKPEQALANVMLSPYLSPILTAVGFAKGTIGEVDLNSAMTAALDSAERVVKDNNLNEVEGMLLAHAQALNLIYSDLVRKAGNNLSAGGEYLPAGETYLKMAMKAQNQCRMTLETLSNVKNPPVVYAKQANINNGGQQQVNNHAHAKKTENPPSKILEQSHEQPQRMDTGPQGKAVEGNSALEAMAEMHGTQVS